jgi:hypothetical protein
MGSMWSTKVHMLSERSRTSGMTQKRLGNVDSVAKGLSVVKWSVHLFGTLLKILSRSLGAIPYGPGAGGIQNVGQTQKSNR